MEEKQRVSIHEKTIHFIEKNYSDGTQKREKVFVKDPLKVKKEEDLISFRYYDYKIIEFKAGNNIKVTNDYTPTNFTNYYYFGTRKTLEDLVEEYEVMKRFDTEVHRNIEKTMEELVGNYKTEVILDYSNNPFNPIRIFPNEGDLTIEEYKKEVRKNSSKVLKK